MLDNKAIIEAIDEACSSEIGTLASIFIANIVANVPDATDKFGAGLRVVLQANRTACQIAESHPPEAPT
jgi:hypothetical protein